MLGLPTSPFAKLLGGFVLALSAGSGSGLVSGHVLESKIGVANQYLTDLEKQKANLEEKIKVTKETYKNVEKEYKTVVAKKDHVDNKAKADRELQSQFQTDLERYKTLSNNLKTIAEEMHSKAVSELRQQLINYVNFSTTCFHQSYLSNQNNEGTGIDLSKEGCKEAKQLSSFLFDDADENRLFVAVK